ncbi:MAG: DUF2993 domain-containing protein [Kastovskya adunca ATA6-11-RM4]|jgi:hypothetical protein|nr:DUF2993 domain-containing protein [Kastovskya adunca ATA6-11-RM4]
MQAVIPGTDGLGEQAINKIAELALSAQIDEAERLEVQVKTDPGRLAQGELESLTIHGEGLAMRQSLRMQEMKIHIMSIAVSPLKALMGNIELTQPAEGTARIVLIEGDINRAFNSEMLSNQMQDLGVEVDGKPVTIDTQQVNCHFLADGKVALDAKILLREVNEIRDVSFTTTPRISADGRGVLLEDVQYAAGKELSPKLTKALMDKASRVLNLSNFEMEGITLRIQQLEVEAGRLTLQAIADVTQFPSM